MPLEEQSTSSSILTGATEPRRKRAKIVSACGECRRKKTKCNGETPCRNCEKSGVPCIYPSSTTHDDKRNAPSKAALEAIEDRLKSIEDMLRAIIKTQNMAAVPEMDPAVSQFLNNTARDSHSPSPSHSPPHQYHLHHSNKSSPTLTSKSPASPIHLPSIRVLSNYSNEPPQQQDHRDLPPIGYQNYPYSNDIDDIMKKRKRQ